MDDVKYFDNVRRIKEIISQLDAGRLPPKDAKKQFEIAKRLIDECEECLNRYSGTVEEISIISAWH
jgi:exodeoxyribonuclease VII small subunit